MRGQKMKEYLVSGSTIDTKSNSVVLRGKRTPTGQEIALRIPVGTLVSLAMHTRRALAAQQAQAAPPAPNGWRAVHALPVATAQVLTVDDQTLGQCLLVLDPGTDVELQLSLQGLDLVRGIAEELMKIADAGSPKRPAVN